MTRFSLIAADWWTKRGESSTFWVGEKRRTILWHSSSLTQDEVVMQSVAFSNITFRSFKSFEMKTWQSANQLFHLYLKPFFHHQCLKDPLRQLQWFWVILASSCHLWHCIFNTLNLKTALNKVRLLEIVLDHDKITNEFEEIKKTFEFWVNFQL